MSRAKRNRTRNARTLWAVLTIASLCLATAGALTLANEYIMRGRAATPSPSLNTYSQQLLPAQTLYDKGTVEGAYVPEYVFPEVDWSYWLSINPDVIGWISIPETEVSYPIALPPALAPTYYLDHDVYRQSNRYGSIYLDDECREEGLDGNWNTIVLGHHMSNGTMFAELANYADASFLEEHETILLQTPQRNIVLEVVAVEIVPGDSARKRTTFLNDADFAAWWSTVAPNVPTPKRVWTFCTCSYHFQDDERTLVYAVEKATL